MTTNRGPFDVGDDLSDINEVDRLLDRLGSGGTTPADFPGDPLLKLLASARQESDADLPAAPNLDELLWAAETDTTEVVKTAETTIAEAEPPVGEGMAALRSETTWDEFFSGDAEENDENIHDRSSSQSGSDRRPSRYFLGRGIAIGGASISMTVLAGGIAAALAVGGAGYATYQFTRSDHIEAPAPEEQPENSISPDEQGHGGTGSSVAEKTGESDVSATKATEENPDDSQHDEPSVEVPSAEPIAEPEGAVPEIGENSTPQEMPSDTTVESSTTENGSEVSTENGAPSDTEHTTPTEMIDPPALTVAPEDIAHPGAALSPHYPLQHSAESMPQTEQPNAG